MNLLQTIRSDVKTSPKTLVYWVLVLSCAYYKFDTSLVEDEIFDKMMLHLGEIYDNISHVHKHLITREHIAAGSLYDVKFPNGVVMLTKMLIKEIENV